MLFSWLFENFALGGQNSRSSADRLCDLRERPADVMLTLFSAMGHLQNDGGVFSLTPMAREHLVKSSPWFIGPYFASVSAEVWLCQADALQQILRTDKPANWAEPSLEPDDLMETEKA